MKRNSNKGTVREEKFVLSITTGKSRPLEPEAAGQTAATAKAQKGTNATVFSSRLPFSIYIFQGPIQA